MYIIIITHITGKWKRLYGKRQVIAYKRRNEKKAVIEYINNTDNSTAIITKT
jgi:hypothetical protein